MNEQRRRFDPLALAVMGAAVVLLVALVAGLLISIRSAPPAAPKPAPAGPSLGERIGELTRQVAKEIADKVREAQPPKSLPTPKPAPKPPAATKPAPAPAPAPSPVGRLNWPVADKPPAGMTWRYRVSVEPPAWKDATLAYRTVEQVKGLAVYTEFRHAGGQMNFQLGMFEPRHPSHANMRFPGFFMYAAYLDKPMAEGQRYTWEWPWQLAGGAVRPGRIKRYSGVLAGVEILPVPAGEYGTARIEGTLEYIDGGKVIATAKETIWYSRKFSQVAKVVREGRTPDEGATRIVAELIELR